VHRGEAGRDGKERWQVGPTAVAALGNRPRTRQARQNGAAERETARGVQRMRAWADRGTTTQGMAAAAVGERAHTSEASEQGRGALGREKACARGNASGARALGGDAGARGWAKERWAARAMWALGRWLGVGRASPQRALGRVRGRPREVAFVGDRYPQGPVEG
jgi:hypothetical protein